MNATNNLRFSLLALLLLFFSGCGLVHGGGMGASTVEVFKYDGSVQCDTGSGVSVDDMRQVLKERDIRVFSARKSDDGMMHAQVCGGTTGKINVYEIELSQLPAARSLGFTPMSELHSGK